MKIKAQFGFLIMRPATKDSSRSYLQKELIQDLLLHTAVQVTDEHGLIDLTLSLQHVLQHQDEPEMKQQLLQQH